MPKATRNLVLYSLWDTVGKVDSMLFLEDEITWRDLAQLLRPQSSAEEVQSYLGPDQSSYQRWLVYAQQRRSQCFPPTVLGTLLVADGARRALQSAHRVQRVKKLLALEKKIRDFLRIVQSDMRGCRGPMDNLVELLQWPWPLFEAVDWLQTPAMVHVRIQPSQLQQRFRWQPETTGKLVVPRYRRPGTYGSVVERGCKFVARSVLRHLSCKQIERLVKQLVPRVYVHDTFIFEQGEIGTAFYIVASGQVQVIIDGKPVRTLARHGHFGERALLFEEPRTATVRVLSSEAELWCLEKAAFVEDSNVELQDLTHVRVIGIGGFGHVRLVEDRVTGLRYALKQVKKVDGQVPPHVRGDLVSLDSSFVGKDHPFILDVMNTYETSSSFYILMEYIMGGTLRHVIKEMQKPFERSEARFYVGSLILVLEVLHDRNIVYRDLKPENVMVDSRGYVKLIDFGIAKRLDEDRQNFDGRTFTCIGSPHYMAPEAILSRREGYGTEVDTWALGILLYELVCGCQPFGDAVKEKQAVA
eukprot:g21606.t1